MRHNPPVPAGSKKVFEGILLDVYQYEQKLYDGSTATFEKYARDDTANVFAITTDGKALIIKQEQPHKQQAYWSFPGGRVDPTDADNQAGAKRELLEETGYEAESFELLYSRTASGKFDWNLELYLALGCRKIGKNKPDAGEKITLYEVDRAQLVAIVFDEDFHDTTAQNYFLLKYYRGELEDWFDEIGLL